MEKVFYSLNQNNPELNTFCRYLVDESSKMVFLNQEKNISDAEKKRILENATFTDFSYSLFRDRKSVNLYKDLPVSSINFVSDFVEAESKKAPAKIERIKKNFDEEFDDEIRRNRAFSGIIGNCEQIKQLKRKIYHVKDKECKVLFLGESGTGKSSSVHALHKAGIYKDKKLVSLNVGALQKDLVETTLFGSVKGAYTDATDRKGLIAIAEDGIIFLDEIGELPLECQIKLLRIFDEGIYRKVGSDKEEKTSARFVFATNKDLKNMVKEKQFREDLYWRIAEFIIEIPPLKERKEDILLLADYFIDMINIKDHSRKFLSRSARDKILSYDWPGNIRELQTCIKMATICSRKDEISASDVNFI
ncbi:MAG: sigma-54-dependent Fis family transcriptional regulator [Treponema sp.]|uniref:sigma-54-dependent transcriptional regulator n=1 Tax=Treponema sp. TaxID=166 RepID=UPI001B43F4BA|nr:sigma-54-dependent Fis family transcriptional regulator [Treponema sp.]